jgi:thioesterase domain-containing protein
VSNQRLSSLRELLYREVPLSRHMGVLAEAYDGEALTLSAELGPNINIHGTAFGGSMYSLAALCGWSLLRLRLEDLSLDAEIMLGSARIDYRRPVRSQLIARATCEAEGFEAFAERIRNGRRASVEVTVTLGSMRNKEWQESAVFSGSYATVNH